MSNAIAESGKSFCKQIVYPLRQRVQIYLDKEGVSTRELYSQCRQVLCFEIHPQGNKMLTFAGGFASYLLGLNRKTYDLSGVGTEGNSPSDVKEPAFGWITGFLFVVCFVGLFVLIPLRKVREEGKEFEHDVYD